MKKVWVLTSSYNMYDQQGEYFIACWLEKPTLEQLLKLKLKIHDYQYENILNKGNCGSFEGIKNGGEVQYELSEKQIGKSYES